MEDLLSVYQAYHPLNQIINWWFIYRLEALFQSYKTINVAPIFSYLFILKLSWLDILDYWQNDQKGVTLPIGFSLKNSTQILWKEYQNVGFTLFFQLVYDSMRLAKKSPSGPIRLLMRPRPLLKRHRREV